jgi:hypothetical protein
MTVIDPPNYTPNPSHGRIGKELNQVDAEKIAFPLFNEKKRALNKSYLLCPYIFLFKKKQNR